MLPTPDAIREDTRGALRWLAERTADSLEAIAEPDHPATVYPTNPMGYQTNTLALAAGTAGVLHALHSAGRDCDPARARPIPRRRVGRGRGITGPGLLVGGAGIAGVWPNSASPRPPSSCCWSRRPIR